MFFAFYEITLMTNIAASLMLMYVQLLSVDVSGYFHVVQHIIYTCLSYGHDSKLVRV